MKAFGKWACAAAILASGAAAASYDDIPDIEVYGQHFFYTNNGTQLYAPVARVRLVETTDR